MQKFINIRFLYCTLKRNVLQYNELASIGLPASANDNISRNVQKSLIFEAMPYTDKAFMSTSPSLDSPALNKDLIMTIYLPSGMGIGAYIDGYNGLDEIEFLLARNSRFMISKAYKDKNIYRIEMELIK